MTKNAAVLEKAVAAIAGAQLVADVPEGERSRLAAAGTQRRAPLNMQRHVSTSRRLYPDTHTAGSEVAELQEYYERMEQARAAAVEGAAKKYASLTPILCKARARERVLC